MSGRRGQRGGQTGPEAGDSGGVKRRQPSADGCRSRSVTAYGSGNAAQVYFDLFPRKITLSELNNAFPSMVDALVQHEGIGVVVGLCRRQDGGRAGQGRARNLHTGEVTGVDPVLAYAPTATAQLPRVVAVETGHGLPAAPATCG